MFTWISHCTTFSITKHIPKITKCLKTFNWCFIFQLQFIHLLWCSSNRWCSFTLHTHCTYKLLLSFSNQPTFYSTASFMHSHLTLTTPNSVTITPFHGSLSSYSLYLALCDRCSSCCQYLKKHPRISSKPTRPSHETLLLQHLRNQAYPQDI